MAYINPCSDKDKADKVLFEFDDLAKSCGIEYTLLVGTCLGFVRDGGYIKGDNDIDVSVKCEETKRERFFDKLKEHSFARNTIPGGMKGENNHFLKSGILMDVWHGKYANSKFLSELKEIEYEGRKFKIPKDVEGYLKYTYGNWRVPAKTKPKP